MSVGEVGADRPVQGVTVNGPQYTADRGRRPSAPPPQRMTTDTDDRQQRVRGLRTPLGEFVDALRTGDDRAGTHQQDRRQRVPPAPPRARIQNRVEVRAHVSDPISVQRTQLHQHSRYRGRYDSTATS